MFIFQLITHFLSDYNSPKFFSALEQNIQSQCPFGTHEFLQY